MPGEFLLDIVALGPIVLVPAFVLSAIAGMIAALIFSREERRLARAPYLALTALVALASISLTLGWTWFSADRVPWLRAAPVLALHLVFGWFLGRLAIARAIDAWGIRGRSWLALLPPAHFGLYLIPPRTPEAATPGRRRKLYTGNAGVAVGLIALALSVAVGQAILLKQVGAFDEDPYGNHLSLAQRLQLRIELRTMVFFAPLAKFTGIGRRLQDARSEDITLFLTYMENGVVGRPNALKRFEYARLFCAEDGIGGNLAARGATVVVSLITPARKPYLQLTIDRRFCMAVNGSKGRAHGTGTRG